MSHVTFECVDCHRCVYSFGVSEAPIPPRCYTCEWIVEHIDPEDYAAVRRAFDVA